MPTIHDLKQSKFLAKSDFPISPTNPTGAILLTVAGYAQQNVAMESQPPEMKWVLKFAEVEKPMVLNSTNGQLIAAFTGSEDFDDWIGRQIVAYFDPSVSFGGQLKGGIRVRAPKAKAAAPVAPKPAAPAPAPKPSTGGVDAPQLPQESDDVPF
jgi:hypothetical protein